MIRVASDLTQSQALKFTCSQVFFSFLSVALSNEVRYCPWTFFLPVARRKPLLCASLWSCRFFLINELAMLTSSYSTRSNSAFVFQILFCTVQDQSRSVGHFSPGILSGLLLQLMRLYHSLMVIFKRVFTITIARKRSRFNHQ